MRTLRWVSLGLLAGATALPGQGTGADSARADSARRLQTVTVSVTRADERTARLPWAVGVQLADDIRRGQATVGVDEALNNVPGVMASNRYIFALDQRLSIRGAGSRANFGTRGVKVLLDGVPQSLPDGQSQLTNVELGTIGRIEVLRGAASSLYGNGSGGVISFETDLRAPDRLMQEVRVLSGDNDLVKWQSRTVGRTGNAVGMLSVSRTTLDGFRQYSSADVRQINAAVNVALGAASTLELRAHSARVPHALNPGALTLAEWTANPDSAAAANIARGARRAIEQNQFSVGLRRSLGAATSIRAVGYYFARDVDNPLATPPPAPAGPTNGTYSVIDRGVFGVRLDGARTFGASADAPRLTLGVDAQRSRDHRRNWRSTGGEIDQPTDTLLINQIETVSSVGPFAQLSWSPTRALQSSVGIRYDHQTFRVRDRFTGDGDDDSGERTMSATSGHFGASYTARPWLIPYVNFSTAFETPTTTELNARDDGTGGFSPDLGPQRIATFEAGARGVAGRVRYDATLFNSHTTDAIIQYQEVNGRAYFRNAGSTKSLGAELGVEVAVASWLGVQVSHTYAEYLFDEYRIPRGAVTDTLDGNRLAGVPERFVRAGLRSRYAAATLDADWTWSDFVWGDDANTVRVGDWGQGRLDVRLAWSGALGDTHFTPFFAVNNAFDQQYVGSITLNGAFGRVRESAPGRNLHFGFDLGWSVLR
ncbi:MAG TPA: TonB-dependent receptor [Gemmatimonadaceae bacterium]|nr:TonB-dependent receptor [Gemmatimonadaceae bacterium]